jgi:hypothetical protein
MLQVTGYFWAIPRLYRYEYTEKEKKVGVSTQYSTDAATQNIHNGATQGGYNNRNWRYSSSN